MFESISTIQKFGTRFDICMFMSNLTSQLEGRKREMEFLAVLKYNNISAFRLTFNGVNLLTENMGTSVKILFFVVVKTNQIIKKLTKIKQ